MSLMNDMLRDLDRRGVRSKRVPAAGRHSPTPARRGWLVASGLAGALLVAAGILWWPWPAFFQNVPAEQTTNQPVIRQPASGQQLPHEQKSGQLELGQQHVDPEIAAPVAPEAKPSPPPTSTPAAADIEPLLAAAREARRRDRLTRPAGENAYEFYQQVLVIAPQNAEAKAGLVAIGLRYRELADTAQRRGESALAEQFLTRARMVSPNHEGQATNQPVAEGAREATHETAPIVEPAASATQEPSRFNVQLDPASEDQRQAAQAQRWWSLGQVSRARNALEQTLAQWSHPDVAPVASTLVLAELYMEQHEWSGLDRLLADTDRLPEDERVRLGALRQLQNGALGDALAHLEAHRESAAENEPYRALMARLFYTETHYTRAAEHYRALLADFGPQPAYWLGLGLAEDAMNDARPALEAFRRALNSGAYRDDNTVRRFLESRIDTLSQQLSQRSS